MYKTSPEHTLESVFCMLLANIGPVDWPNNRNLPVANDVCSTYNDAINDIIQKKKAEYARSGTAAARK